jgi:hypothetical protein
MAYFRAARVALALLAVIGLLGSVQALQVSVVTQTANPRPSGKDSIQIQAQVDGSSIASGRYNRPPLDLSRLDNVTKKKFTKISQ